MKQRTDGLFTRGVRLTPEQRAKIKAGVKRDWLTRPRSAKLMAEIRKSEEVKRWVESELAKCRKA